MSMDNKGTQKRKNSADSNKKCRVKYSCENVYLYLQIIITIIFMLSAVLLKGNDSVAYYTIKDNYKVFFTTETEQESNYSYNSFFSSLSEDIKEKYKDFTQTAAYIYGKGKSDIYPSNISFEKYIPQQKGLKPVEGVVTSDFGIRKDPFDKKQKDFHTGLDIAAPKGTFIRSAFDGVVTETGCTNIAGNYIKVKTDEQMQTFYGHMQFVFVKQGDKVLKGQVIATVGDTGMVTGPHLHFEIIRNGNRVNPIYAIE